MTSTFSKQEVPNQRIPSGIPTKYITVLKMEVLKMEVLRMEKISIPQMLYKFPNTSNCHWNPWKHLCWQKVFPGAKSLITGNPGENYSKKNELICSFPIKKKQATCWLDLPDNESTNERANERTNERTNEKVILLMFLC